MSQDTEHKNNSQADDLVDKRLMTGADNRECNAKDGLPDNDSNTLGSIDTTETLKDEDFSEDIRQQDRETIKKVAHDVKKVKEQTAEARADIEARRL